jgi:hypothetical protein
MEEEEDGGPLLEIAARLAELQRSAEAAELPKLALLLEDARVEAEKRLAERQECPPKIKA